LSRPKSQLAFIDQFTRRLTVRWADHEIHTGSPPVLEDYSDEYVEFALSKGWLTKREPRRLTAKGWQVATSFLKR